MLHPIAPRPHQSVEERGQIRIAARRQAQIRLAKVWRMGGVTVFIDPLFFAVQIDLERFAIACTGAAPRVVYSRRRFLV
jgi:hypothetical protein